MSFPPDHFRRLERYGGQWRDPSNAEHQAAYQALKSDYDRTRDWAVALQKLLFPGGRFDVRRSPINQAQRFHPYTWAKIFPQKDSPKELAYTVGTGAEYGFVVKLDVTTSGILRERFLEEIQGGLSNESGVVSILSEADGCAMTMEQLVDWSAQAIQGFDATYEQVCRSLGIRTVGDASDSVDSEESEENMGGAIDRPRSVNRILYGPPGTGKTWSTRRHAVALATRSTLEEVENRGDEWIRGRWKALTESGHIRFVTFHPAMTYEDFIEGLKPVLVEGTVSYEMKAGILRELCDDALSKSPIKETKDAISSFLIELSEAPIQLKTKYEKEFTVSYQGNTTFSVMPKSSGSRTPYPVSIGDVRTALDSGVVGDAYNRAYVQPIADEIRRRHPATASAVTEVTDFVLVIDEINRGNVPAILGEVITLLEPDKRLGAEEELTVVLPGSRHRFGIPANLHVVGTMNTSDRSVEALDIALRRRFEFVEMPPNSSVLDKLGCEVEGLKMSSLLEAINSRLEVLRDREHLIGHAPFVNVRTLEALRNAFRHGIIPLLQEYFYSDWGKIGAVLGKGFVTERSRKATLKPGFDADDITDDAVWDLTSDWSLDTFRSILD